MGCPTEKCTVSDDCRCYAYSDNDSKKVCGKRVNGYIFPCGKSCCVSDCSTIDEELLDKGKRIETDSIITLTILTACMCLVIMLSFVVRN